MKTISKDTPLAEITLRKYEQPNNLTQRELIKKLCLSFGLLQPGDSRDIIVDVLLVLINNKEPLSSEKINDIVIETRKKENLPLKGIAGSNIRRQLKRLKDLFLIETNLNTPKRKNGRRIYGNFSNSFIPTLCLGLLAKK